MSKFFEIILPYFDMLIFRKKILPNVALSYQECNSFRFLPYHIVSTYICKCTFDSFFSGYTACMNAKYFKHAEVVKYFEDNGYAPTCSMDGPCLAARENFGNLNEDDETFFSDFC